MTGTAMIYDAMIYLPTYLLLGIAITALRFWALRRFWKVVLPTNAITWFFCVLIWPADLVASVFRVVRLRARLAAARRVSK